MERPPVIKRLDGGPRVVVLVALAAAFLAGLARGMVLL